MEPLESTGLAIHQAIVRNWGLIALRGVVTLIFGVLTLLQPGIALLALVLVFGFYAIADGVLMIGAAIARRREERHWAPQVIGGLLGVAAGVIALAWPGITAVALLFVIAAWAIVKGVTEIVTAYRVRKLIAGEGLLMLAGAVSILFGVLVAMFPAAGALGIVLWIGAWASVSGVLLLLVAFRLRRWGREHDVLTG